MTDPTPEARGARAELLDLCARGLDWRVDPARVLEDPSAARPAAVTDTVPDFPWTLP